MGTIQKTLILLIGGVFCATVTSAVALNPDPAIDTPTPQQIPVLVSDPVVQPVSLSSEPTAAESSVTIVKTIKMATIIRPPFVMETASGLDGFSIELWDEITERMNMRSEYVLQTDFTAMLDQVRSKQSDGAIANITITAERERAMDFSLPIYNSGLQIVVPNTLQIFSVWKPLSDSKVWQVIGTLAMIWVLLLHVLWLAGKKTHALFRNAYPTGLFDAFTWVTFSQLREDVPHSTGFQLIAAFLRIFSLVSMFLLTAVFASYLTIDHLRSNIAAYQDLFGKKVGVTQGSTSQKFLQQQNIPTIAYTDFDQLKNHVETGRLDAMVHDAPIVQYYAQTMGAGKVSLVSSIFKPEQFGVLLNDNSPLRSDVNDILLQMQEDGEYQKIYNRWFSQ